MNRIHPPRFMFPLILLGLCASLLAIPVHARWSEEGVRIDPGSWALYSTLLNSETAGEFYVGWTRPGSTGWDARVQRFSEDGTKLWGSTGKRLVADSLAGSGYLMGIVRTEDDCILAAYLSFLQDTALVMVQKLSSTGERLWGAEGVPGSAWEGDHQYNITEDPKWVVSDGAGGVWIVWDVVWNGRVYVSGVNSDGILKLADSVIDLGEYNSPDFRPLFTTDNNGGLVVFWPPPHPEPTCKRIRAAHIAADGTVLGNGIVMELPSQGLERFDDPFALVNDLEGGYYFSTGKYVQRFRSNLTARWPNDEGVQLPNAGFIEPTPIVLEGNILLRYNNFHGQSIAMFIYPDGTLGNDGDWTPIGLQIGGAAGAMQILPGGSEFFVYKSISMPDSFSYAQMHIQRIHMSNGYSWPGDTLLLLPQAIHGEPWAITKLPIVLPDSSTVYSILFWEQQVTKLYKLFPDGRLAGRDVSVGEPNSPAQPSDFRVVNAWPNPFNSSVSIQLDLPESGTAELVFTNILGQEVDRLAISSAGKIRQVEWHPGGSLSSGIYLVYLRGGAKRSKPIKIAYLP